MMAEKGEEGLWAERVVRTVKRAFAHVELSTWALCERLLAQAHACAELIDQWRLEFPEAAQLLSEAGSYLFARGQYTQAALLYERALDIYEKALGPEHSNVATCLENYAYLLRKMDRPEEAAPLESRATAIRAKHT